MKTKKIMFWLIVLSLVVQLAAATGIRPAKTSLAVDEGRDYGGEFWIINNDARKFSVDIFVEGEMAEYVQLKKNTITFREDEEAEPVEFEVHLPEEVPPGQSFANIIVQEKLPGNDPGVISSVIVLKHKIIIEGPYPEKYVKTKINFQENPKTIKFVSEVENLGSKDIENLKTTFYVNDKEQNQQKLETEKTALSSKQTTLLSAEMDRESFDQGEYVVSAVTSYDGQNVEIYKNLIVGKPEVEITYFNKYFIANTINEYSMDLLNRWNKEIKNVFVDVEVKKDQKKIDQFRTKSVDIKGEMTERINDYLDAKDKGPGIYTFEMAVNFWNLVRMDVSKFEIESEFVSEKDADSIGRRGLTGNAVGLGGSGSWKWILISLIGILGGAAGIYAGYRYKRRDQYE